MPYFAYGTYSQLLTGKEWPNKKQQLLGCAKQLSVTSVSFILFAMYTLSEVEDQTAYDFLRMLTSLPVVPR